VLLSWRVRSQESGHSSLQFLQVAVSQLRWRRLTVGSLARTLMQFVSYKGRRDYYTGDAPDVNLW